MINIESEEISQQSKINSNKDGKENDIKQILDNLRNELEQQKNQQKIQHQKIENLNQQLKNQNQLIENQNLIIDSQSQKIDSQSQKIESQNQKIIIQQNENKIQKMEIDTINVKFQEQVKALYKNMFSIKSRLETVEVELNLIKSRGALKTFIDFFYRGFKLNGAILYEDKFTKIAEVLNKYNDARTDDIDTVNKIRVLLKESVVKLQQSNLNAHIIDKSKPILVQLFKLVDPSNNYDIVIQKLESINADNIMTDSIKNKENFYQDFNYDILKEKEQKTFDRIEYDKLCLILKNKK
jgi:hypothetical protein